MSEGWIKTHRSKLHWEWFTDYKTSHLFEYLLLCASHNEYNWRGKKFTAGQLPFGLTKASSETGLSVRMIRTSLDKLKATSEVTIETSNQGSVITIVKWSQYQIATSKKTNKRQAKDKQTTTTKNVNNEKNENKYDLDLIYAQYPKKVGKASGMKKLHSIVKTQELYDKVMQGVINYKELCLEENVDMKYIKQFSTFVNGEHWNDELISEYTNTKNKEKDLLNQVESLMNKGF